MDSLARLSLTQVSVSRAACAAPSETPRGDKPNADRLVFTSVPSATREGYRVVAATRGVTQSERAEIATRAPSHDSLCGPDAGFLSFPLRSGRHAVAACAHAGVEHTARGGHRVLSDFAVVDTDRFQSLAGNPLCVLDLLDPDAVTLEDIDSCRAECLSLPEPPDGAFWHHPPSALAGSTEVLMNAVRVLLFGGNGVVTGVRHPKALIEWALLMTPAGLRTQRSVSAGLRFSPGRRVNLTALPGIDQETARLLRGGGVEEIRGDSRAERRSSPAAPWLGMLESWWRSGRHRELVRLANVMTGPVSPALLLETARLWDSMSDGWEGSEVVDPEARRARLERIAPGQAGEVAEALLRAATTAP